MSLVQVAAEREAWDASKKHNFELITICPTFVLGPVISNRADATSILDVKVHDLAMMVLLPYAMHAALKHESVPTSVLGSAHKSSAVKKLQSTHLKSTVGIVSRCTTSWTDLF